MDSTISFSTDGELADAIGAIGSEEVAVFKFVGSCTLMEAATMYRRLKGHVASTRGLWSVQHASEEILRRGAEHYEELDMLDLLLDLMELDLKDSIPMRKIRFDSVRATANSVVTTADDTNVLDLLDNVTIDSQRLARVSRGLCFGREDVEVAILCEEDLSWLMEDGAGAHVLAGEGGESVADLEGGESVADLEGGESVADLDSGEFVADLDSGESVADLDSVDDDGGGDSADGDDGGDSADVAVAVAGGNVLAAVGGKVLMKVLAASADVAEAVAGGNVLAGVGGKEGPQLLADQPLLDDQENLGIVRGHGDASEQPGAWIELKEKTVVALMRFKIRRLREAIVRAKGRLVVA